MEAFLLDLVISRKKITIICFLVILISILLMQIRGVDILESTTISVIILAMFFLGVPLSKWFFELLDRNLIKKKVLFQFAKFNFYSSLLIGFFGFFYISIEILIAEDPAALNWAPVFLSASYGSALYMKGYKSVL